MPDNRQSTRSQSAVNRHKIILTDCCKKTTLLQENNMRLEMPEVTKVLKDKQELDSRWVKPVAEWLIDNCPGPRSKQDKVRWRKPSDYVVADTDSLKDTRLDVDTLTLENSKVRSVKRQKML